MKEFDLIPESYRLYLSKVKVFKVSLFVLIISIAASSIAFGAIEIVKQSANKKISQLKSANDVAQQQQKTLNDLQRVKNDLENKWNILNGLRSTASPEVLLYAIDHALLDSNVWFTNLRFDRTESSIQDEELVDTGYFIVIKTDNDKLPLSIGTKITIAGGAHNHSTLSKFVKNLLDQAVILDAKVLQTSTNNRDKHIDYVLEIVVNSKQSARS
ncbi:MAG: hypothetical protein AB8B89_04125 [Gammaproteobacteria bacterium]